MRAEIPSHLWMPCREQFEPAYTRVRCAPSHPIGWGPVALDLRRMELWFRLTLFPIAPRCADSTRPRSRSCGSAAKSRRLTTPLAPSRRCSHRTDLLHPEPVVRSDLGTFGIGQSLPITRTFAPEQLEKSHPILTRRLRFRHNAACSRLAFVSGREHAAFLFSQLPSSIFHRRGRGGRRGIQLH